MSHTSYDLSMIVMRYVMKKLRDEDASEEQKALEAILPELREIPGGKLGLGAEMDPHRLDIDMDILIDTPEEID
jgi:hypothetical protein